MPARWAIVVDLSPSAQMGGGRRHACHRNSFTPALLAVLTLIIWGTSVVRAERGDDSDEEAPAEPEGALQGVEVRQALPPGLVSLDAFRRVFPSSRGSSSRSGSTSSSSSSSISSVKELRLGTNWSERGRFGPERSADGAGPQRVKRRQQLLSTAFSLAKQGAGVPAKVVPCDQASNKRGMVNASTTSRPLVLQDAVALPMTIPTIFGFSWHTAALEAWKKVLMALGGGTGASLGATGSLQADTDLYHRMRIQDQAVLFLLLVAYGVALALSASIGFHNAANDSPVTFYTNPHQQPLMMEGHSVESFINTFNQPSKNAYLQVTGYAASADETVGSVQWEGTYYNVVFTFALELAPWIEREADPVPAANVRGSSSIGGSQERRSESRLLQGLTASEYSRLCNFLAHDRNDLATVQIVKEISWAGWEDLAQNIKHRIRQSGFGGLITVTRTEEESITVYKNRQWANFMHSRMMKVLCALSVVGWVVYGPYMWWRCTVVPIRARFRVGIDIAEYWAIIAASLSEQGFAVPVALEASASEGVAGQDGRGDAAGPDGDAAAGDAARD